MRKIAVLTSGGDAPGMNSAVVAVARTAAHYGMPLIGIHRGYNGIIIYEPRLMDALEKKMLSVVTEPAEKVLVGQIFEVCAPALPWRCRIPARCCANTAASSRCMSISATSSPNILSSRRI